MQDEHGWLATALRLNKFEASHSPQYPGWNEKPENNSAHVLQCNNNTAEWNDTTIQGITEDALSKTETNVVKQRIIEGAKEYLNGTQSIPIQEDY